MSKVELTISPNYVPNWTIVDAMRELFQNALDQESTDHENVAEWNYNEDSCQVIISNKKTHLPINSLLLGQTTKADDKATIGKFGEGYKIATLVLLRNEKNVVFYNYGAREIWRPRFVKSRKFGTNILTFFIEHQPVWSAPTNNSLSITIDNISPEEWTEIVDSNLHIRSDYEVLEENEFGRIINLQGKVFINGLFVCDYKPYKHGYDFKPEYIRIDRDRKMANDFDLRWMASKMWGRSADTTCVLDMIKEGCQDVAFLNDVSRTQDAWRDKAYSEFYDVYGQEAIPVTSQYELDHVPHGRRGIIVTQSYQSLIVGSSSYVHVELKKDEPSVKELLESWMSSVRDCISDAAYDEFVSILDELDD